MFKHYFLVTPKTNLEIGDDKIINPKIFEDMKDVFHYVITSNQPIIIYEVTTSENLEENKTYSRDDFNSCKITIMDVHTAVQQMMGNFKEIYDNKLEEILEKNEKIDIDEYFFKKRKSAPTPKADSFKIKEIPAKFFVKDPLTDKPSAIRYLQELPNDYEAYAKVAHKWRHNPEILQYARHLSLASMENIEAAKLIFISANLIHKLGSPDVIKIYHNYRYTENFLEFLKKELNIQSTALLPNIINKHPELMEVINASAGLNAIYHLQVEQLKAQGVDINNGALPHISDGPLKEAFNKYRDQNLNPFDILGLPKDADENAINQKYRKLALQHHPDRNQGKTFVAKEEFQKLTEAMDLLKDEKIREYFRNNPASVAEHLKMGKNQL